MMPSDVLVHVGLGGVRCSHQSKLTQPHRLMLAASMSPGLQNSGWRVNRHSMDGLKDENGPPVFSGVVDRFSAHAGSHFGGGHAGPWPLKLCP